MGRIGPHPLDRKFGAGCRIYFQYAFGHRVHHGSNPEYIDKNFGNLLMIWDRMFGTYAKEEAAVYSD